MADPQQQPQSSGLTPPPAASSSTAASPALKPEDVMADPEFLSHDGDTQRAILLKIDPTGYGKLDRIAQNQVIAHLQQSGGRQAGRAAPSAPPATGFRRGAESEAGNLMLAPFELGAQAVNAPVKTAVHLGKEIVAQPLRELAGQPQPGEDTATAAKLYPSDARGFNRAGLPIRAFNMIDSLVGGNPAAARAAAAKGDTSEALAHLITTPLITLGLGGLLKTARKDVAATRQEVSALQDISGGAITGSGPKDAAGRVAEIQRVVKQVLAKRGITDDQLKKLFPSREKAAQSDLVGDVGRGNQLILDVARDAVGFVHQPIDAVMTRFGKQSSGPVSARIAKSLSDQADEIGKVNEPLASSIRELGKKVASAKTFEELNDIKSHANKMLGDVYSAVPGRAIDATAERAYAYKLAADNIRREMYPALQRQSGSSLDLAKLGQREADAIAMRDGIFQHYYRDVAPEQSGKEAASFMEYTLAGQGAPGHSFYSRHVISRGLEKTGVVPTAGAQFNREFRRGTGPVGKGMQPERVVTTPGTPSAPSVALGPGAPRLMGTTRSIIHDGQPVGHIIYNVSGDTLTVHHFGGPQTDYDRLSNTLGQQGVRDLAQQLLANHPEVKYVDGIRVGGARGDAGRSVRVPVTRLLSKGEPIKIVPYKPGRVGRFSHPVAKGAAAGRASQAVRGLTPPPQPPSADDDEEPPE
jgi:hypothetical protein